MNVNITGIYDNTVIVDSNLFDDVRLLQTGLSSLNDTLLNVVEGLPFQYANLTTFTILSDNYDAYKITTNSSLTNINSDIDNLNTSLSNLSINISNNFVNNTTFTTLSDNYDAYKITNNSNLINMNVTSTTIFNNLNSLSNNTTLLINNKTNFSNLFVSGASTLLSSFNVSGTTRFNGATTCISTLNVSGVTRLNYVTIVNPTTCMSSLNVAGATLFVGATTCISSLNISGTTRFNGATTCISSLNVSGTTTLNGTTINGTLNIVNNIICSGTALTNLNYDAITNKPDLTIYSTNTTISILTTAIDNQFALTTTYIDDEILISKAYTDQEITTLRNEGYIQEAVIQLLAWATSDEGKRFRKKIWDRIKLKWLSFTGGRPFTELIDDIQNASTDELDEMLKIYRYKDDPISGLLAIAGIRSDPFSGKEICMKGDTYIYSGNLFLTGDIHKGAFNTTTGAWTEEKNLNNYFVMKGVKSTHCLDINSASELLELHYDDLDFDLGPTPTYNLKLKYPIHSVHPTQCLSINPTTKQLEFNINTDYLEFETNTKKKFKTKIRIERC